MRKIFMLVGFLTTIVLSAQKMTLEQANHLASLPIKCLQQEYPNKLGQLLQDASEIQSPKALHPAFYGCFDWHSSVHGHWSLVYLLNHYPNLAQRDFIINKLNVNLSKANVDAEVAYLSKNHEKTFERTYGWAWLLKLQMELDQSKDAYAAPLASNLRPLTTLLVNRFMEFLPKLLYPQRAGMHINSAFAMSMAWDYTVANRNEAFQKVLKESAMRLYKNDENCPFAWEPSGADFLSPCLEEMGIMQRVMEPVAFKKWLKAFAPELFKKKFSWDVAKVSDRTDGHLVHLDGLNFSRAWNLYYLIQQYPKEFAHLKAMADMHMQFSLPSVVDGNYEGEHWLATFAIMAYDRSALSN